MKNSTADVASFLGNYNSHAGVFAHNNALSAWATLYVNTTNASDGGDVILTGGGNVGIATSSPSYRLSVNGTGYASTDFRAPIFYDSDNTGYYVNPASATVINDVKATTATFGVRVNNSSFGGNVTGLTGTFPIEVRASSSPPALTWHYENVATRHIALDSSGFLQVWNPSESGGSVLQAQTSLRAPVFYDSDDTSYYVDPNAATSFRLKSGYIHGYSNSNAYIAFNNSGTYWGTIGNYSSNDWRLGWGTAAALTDWGLRWDASGNTWSNVTHRAPIFYDSDDTGYYVDPNANSLLHVLRVNANWGDGFYGTEAFSITGSYPSMCYRNSSADNKWLFHHDGSYMQFYYGGTWNNNSWSRYAQISTFDIHHVSSIRAPIFYDRDDTTYYIDPASTGTSLNLAGYAYIGKGISGSYYLTLNHDQLWAQGTLYLQYSVNGNINMCHGGGYAYSETSLRAPIFYDTDDTGYYLNPNGTSNLYRTSTYLAPKYQSGDWADAFRNTPVSSKAFHGDISSGGPTGTWWFYESMRHANGDNYWGTQIAYGWEDNANQIYQRNISVNSFSSWVRYLNSSNYQSYSNFGDNPIYGRLYYDYGNTGYYCDPASTSNMNSLSLNSLTVGGVSITGSGSGASSRIWKASSARNLDYQSGQTYVNSPQSVLWGSPSNGLGSYTSSSTPFTVSANTIYDMELVFTMNQSAGSATTMVFGMYTTATCDVFSYANITKSGSTTSNSQVFSGQTATGTYVVKMVIAVSGTGGFIHPYIYFGTPTPNGGGITIQMTYLKLTVIGTTTGSVTTV